MPTSPQQGKSESRLIVRSLVTALLIAGVVYGEKHLESVFAQWPQWLPPLGMVVAISVIVWWAMRPRQRRPVATRPLPADQQPSTPVSPSSVQLLQSTMDEVRQTLKRTANGRHRRNAWRTYPRYLLIGASASGKTGLLEGLARLVPPLARPSVPLPTPTPACTWWVFPGAVILDTCGRYVSALPQTQDHDEWCGVLEFLQGSRGRQPLNGIVLAVGADALGMQPLEVLRRRAVAVRQRLHEARRTLGMDIPLYILVTRCDLLEGFVEFFAPLPEYARTQVFGWVHAARPSRGRQSPPLMDALSVAEMSATLTRRLDQLRLFLLNETPRTGIWRRRIFAFPEEFRALQQCLGVFLETLCSLDVPLDPPLLRSLFLCSAQQRGRPFSTLRHELGFKTPIQSLEESTTSYFLHDFLTVILPRDHRLARPTARTSRLPQSPLPQEDGFITG